MPAIHNSPHERARNENPHRTGADAAHVLRLNDVVELGAAAGCFVLPRVSPQPLVLFAGGIGITPFMSLLESLADGAQGPEIWLCVAHRNLASQAFRERIALHATRLPRLKVFDHYRAPAPQETPGRHVASQLRVDASLIDESLIARRARFYLCGPEPMMNDLIGGLMARGVPRFDILSEVFRSPVAPVAPVAQVLDGDQCFQVPFARSGGAPVTWSAAQVALLGFGESLGITMPSGCRVGQCESRAVRLLSGKIRHLHGREPEDDATCLTCQAIPLEDIVLDA